jgi:hypothetical protein
MSGVRWSGRGELGALGCVPLLRNVPSKLVGSSPFIGISSMSMSPSVKSPYTLLNSPRPPVNWGHKKNMFPTCSPVLLKNRK